MINHSKLWLLYDDKSNKYFSKDFHHVLEKSSSWLYYGFFYKEIYGCEFSDTKCIYEMNKCIIEENDTVVDLGANVGFFSNYAAKKCKKLISVEGSPELYSCLVKNTAEENDNIEYLNANIISKNNSNLDVWSRNPSKISLTLEDIFKIYNLEKIDFLKVDIEGSEYHIFENLDPLLFKKIRKIAIEVHDDEKNIKLLNDLKDKNNFAFNWYINDCKTTTFYLTND